MQGNLVAVQLLREGSDFGSSGMRPELLLLFYVIKKKKKKTLKEMR